MSTNNAGKPKDINPCGCPSISPYECTIEKLGDKATGDNLCQCSCHASFFNEAEKEEAEAEAQPG